MLPFRLVAAVAIHRHPSHYAPPVTTRVAAVAPPKSHNLIHHGRQRNPTTRYIIVYACIIIFIRCWPVCWLSTTRCCQHTHTALRGWSRAASPIMLQWSPCVDDSDVCRVFCDDRPVSTCHCFGCCCCCSSLSAGLCVCRLHSLALQTLSWHSRLDVRALVSQSVSQYAVLLAYWREQFNFELPNVTSTRHTSLFFW